MHVSDWPKRPNMVPRPNLGGDSTFLCHGPLGQGVLFFVPATTLTLGFKNVCGLVCVKVKWFGPGTFRIGLSPLKNWLEILHEVGLGEPS